MDKQNIKLLEIEGNFDVIKFIRVHTDELYAGYKTFIKLFGQYNDVHYLLKLIAELESSFTEN